MTPVAPVGMTLMEKLKASIQLRGEDDETFRQFRRHAPRIEVLIMGQSDIKSAIDPEVIPVEAFNFSDYGENFIESYHKLRFHLKDMPNLKMVMLPLGPWSFSSYRTDRLRTFVYRRGYIGWRDLGELSRLKGRDVYRQKLKGYIQIVDPLAVRRSLKSLLQVLRGGQPLPLKGRVVRGHRRSTQSDVNPRAARKMVRHQLEGKVVFDPHLLDYFGRLLKLCRENGLTVITVACPVVDIYLEVASDYVTWAQLTDKVWGELGLGDMIDRQVGGIDVFPTEYSLFVDQNHLNIDGARRFTALVLSQVADLLPGRSGSIPTETPG